MRALALFAFALFALSGLNACSPAADLTQPASAPTEPITQSASAKSALLREIAGSWRFAEDDLTAESFSTVTFKGETMLLGAAPNASRHALRMPLSNISDGMYQIEWGAKGADPGISPDNNEMLCGAGGVNIPAFVRLRMIGDELLTEFHKIDVNTDSAKDFFDPWPEPCLTLRWQR